MLYPLLLTLVGFSCYCLLVIVLKARNELLIRERRQHWVKLLIVGEKK
jgi:heme exporter protein C